ncbi:MAG TPA: AraC family transcriptional regulator [Kofleriaceae bacterium]|nr:AraC family transcriptional regulator [Kofleriaceae bacterium]
MRDAPDTISAVVVHAVLDALASLDADRGAVIDAAGLDAAMLADPSSRVSSHVLERLWHAAERATADRHVGLAVATRIPPGALGAFDYLIRNTPTLRTTIDRADRFLRLVDDHARIALIERGGRASFRFWSAQGVPWTHHDLECLFAVLVGVIRRAFPDRAPPVVRFAHAAVPPHARYVAAFGAPPVFDAEHYELDVPSALLDERITSVDSALGAVLESHVAHLVSVLPESGTTAQIRRVVRDRLPHGAVSLDRVARELHVSARTLRRRLEDEGTSFRDVVDGVRRDLATHYVGETRRPLKEVAALLGFTDQSTFQRAFKRWHDATPASFRRRTRA